MFGLFNAIYWTHVKMAADSSREPLAKNFAPGETEINWDRHLVTRDDVIKSGTSYND